MRAIAQNGLGRLFPTGPSVNRTGILEPCAQGFKAEAHCNGLPIRTPTTRSLAFLTFTLRCSSPPKSSTFSTSSFSLLVTSVRILLLSIYQQLKQPVSIQYGGPIKIRRPGRGRHRRRRWVGQGICHLLRVSRRQRRRQRPGRFLQG